MGLDMYLTKKTPHERHEVAYWRKANAIHAWFVAHCQDGVDDCREAEVSSAQLSDLVALCKQVLDSVETVEGTVNDGRIHHRDGRVEQIEHSGLVVAQAGLANSLLPTQSGFFFGSTDYDEYYLADLRNTVQMLELLLAEGDGDFFYQASW